MTANARPVRKAGTQAIAAVPAEMAALTAAILIIPDAQIVSGFGARNVEPARMVAGLILRVNTIWHATKSVTFKRL
jgi:hypothetical protein